LPIELAAARVKSRSRLVAAIRTWGAKRKIAPATRATS